MKYNYSDLSDWVGYACCLLGRGNSCRTDGHCPSPISVQDADFDNFCVACIAKARGY